MQSNQNLPQGGVTASTTDFRTAAATTTTLTNVAATVNAATQGLTEIQKQLARARELKALRDQMNAKPNQINQSVQELLSLQTQLKNERAAIAQEEVLIQNQAVQIEEQVVALMSTTAKLQKSIKLLESAISKKRCADDLDDESEETKRLITESEKLQDGQTKASAFDKAITGKLDQELKAKKQRHNMVFAETQKIRTALATPEPESVIDSVSTSNLRQILGKK